MPEHAEEIARPEGIEVPETRSFTATILGTPEVRDAEDGSFEFVGYAATFGRKSVDLGGFREILHHQAFDAVLDDEHLDVRFLFNHEPNLLLARSTSGTLELRSDPKGLRVYARVAPTSYGKDLKILVQRGDINAMSFAFTVGEDRWVKENDEVVRYVRSVASLTDVSMVVNPAYPSSKIVSMRDALSAAAEEAPADEQVVEEAREEAQVNDPSEAPVAPAEETRDGQAELDLARARIALKRHSL